MKEIITVSRVKKNPMTLQNLCITFLKNRIPRPFEHLVRSSQCRLDAATLYSQLFPPSDPVHDLSRLHPAVDNGNAFRRQIWLDEVRCNIFQACSCCEL